MEVTAHVVGGNLTAQDVSSRFTWEQVWIYLARARERTAAEVRRKHGLDKGIPIFDFVKTLKGRKQ